MNRANAVDKLILALLIITILTILSTAISVNREVNHLQKVAKTCQSLS